MKPPNRTAAERGIPLPFVKIYGSDLFSSSLWSESPEVRILFIWMLGVADDLGFVQRHSLGSMARLANLPEDAVVRALDVLLSPDPDSRSTDHDGRRIVPADDGGWRVVNARLFREIRTREQLLAARRQARYRSKSKTGSVSKRRRKASKLKQDAQDALLAELGTGDITADDLEAVKAEWGPSRTLVDHESESAAWDRTHGIGGKDWAKPG